MGNITRESAARVVVQGPVESHSDDIHGYTIDFLTFNETVDGAALLKGLPGDQCHCPHWGYVFKGTFGFRFEDREESYGPGDAFYAPPGHIPTATADTELVMFSPADALKATDEAIKRNLEAMGHAAS